MIPLRYVGILLLLFTISVAIRWPHLGRPMGKHHEFCTATALRVLTVWEQEGIASKGFNPATNFAGIANKNINNHASGSRTMVDAQGNYYYVSHPPLAYYLPHAAFSVLHLEATVGSVVIFNLLINLLCGFGIFLLANKLLPDDDWIGVLSALIYWFTPAVLWFQSNVYMSDMMVQPFFIGILLLVLTIRVNPRPAYIALLAVVGFLATYTTWFGLLITGSSAVYFLWYRGQHTARWYILVALAISQLVALGLMAWQYSQIAGADAYGAELTHRFGQRGTSPQHIWGLSIQLIKNYVANYGALLFFIPVLVLMKKKFLVIDGFNAFMFIGLVPIALLHLLLAEYSGHDFTTLYLSVPLSIVIAAAIRQIDAGKHQELMETAVVISCIVSGIVLYTTINPYGTFSFNGDRYDQELVEGLILKQEPDAAVLFVIGYTPSPEALWYAKRNVMQVASEEEAMTFLVQYGLREGIIFKRATNSKLQKVKTLSL